MRSLPLTLSTAAMALLPFAREVHPFSPSVASVSTAIVARDGPAVIATALRFGVDGVVVDDDDDVFRDDTTGDSSSSSSSSRRRRKILRTALLAAPFATLTTTAAAPPPALAASEKPPPIIPLTTTARRLRAVPTFAIVDGDGVPFHTYDKESAGGFGYFFASYTSATYVLDDARKAYAKAKSAEEAAGLKFEEGTTGGDSGGGGGGGGGSTSGEEGAGSVPDAWGQARIVTVPLDAAMQLSVKKSTSVATNGKGKSFSTYYQVIPETNDLNAALKIENGPRYSERGRVPLFYADGLTLPPSGEGEAATNPVYFRVQDLRDEWERQRPGEELKVRVRELNETFRAMIRPGGKDESVRNLVFVPIPDSVERAKSTARSYKLGTMILTK